MCHAFTARLRLALLPGSVEQPYNSRPPQERQSGVEASACSLLHVCQNSFVCGRVLCSVWESGEQDHSPPVVKASRDARCSPGQPLAIVLGSGHLSRRTGKQAASTHLSALVRESRRMTRPESHMDPQTGGMVRAYRERIHIASRTQATSSRTRARNAVSVATRSSIRAVTQCPLRTPRPSISPP